jgi:hypothetical protein
MEYMLQVLVPQKKTPFGAGKREIWKVQRAMEENRTVSGGDVVEV